MSRKLTSSDRKSLIRLASELPTGSPERKAILSGLKKSASGRVSGDELTEQDLMIMVSSARKAWRPLRRELTSNGFRIIQGSNTRNFKIGHNIKAPNGNWLIFNTFFPRSLNKRFSFGVVAIGKAGSNEAPKSDLAVSTWGIGTRQKNLLRGGMDLGDVLNAIQENVVFMRKWISKNS